MQNLGIILRADIALDYATAFIQHFETETEAELKKYKDYLNTIGGKALADKLPDFLTACGGMVIQKSHQPFSLGYHLAEDLCNYAKEKSRQQRSSNLDVIPSSLSFHLLTSTLSSHRSDIETHEYSASQNGSPIPVELALGGYGVGRVKSCLPKLAHLLQLRDQVSAKDNIGMNAVRQITSLVLQSVAELKQYERRLNELIKPSELSSLKQTVRTLLADENAANEYLFCALKNPKNGNRQPYYCSPLVDLLCIAKGDVK